MNGFQQYTGDSCSLDADQITCVLRTISQMRTAVGLPGLTVTPSGRPQPHPGRPCTQQVSGELVSEQTVSDSVSHACDSDSNNRSKIGALN